MRISSMLRNIGIFTLLTAILTSFVGCMSPAINDPARVGPFFRPTNVSHDVTLGGIRRVLLLPTYGGTAASEESAAGLDPVFCHALQLQNRFEVVTISREECRRRFGASSFSSAGALPHDFLPILRRVYAVDAVMFVDVTVYSAYPPLALGVRSKLATVNGARLVWTFDNVFSADNPLVASAARHYALVGEQRGIPGDSTPAALQSPSRFAAYVADTTFKTLPPVTLGALTESSTGQH